MEIEGLIKLLELYNALTGSDCSFVFRSQNNSTVVVASFPEIKNSQAALVELGELFSSSVKPKKNSGVRIEKKLDALGFSSYASYELVFDSESKFFIASLFKEASPRANPDLKITLAREVIAKQLSLSEELHKKYIETTSNIKPIVYSTNADGSKYYFVSNSVYNLFGLTPEEVSKNKFSLIKKILPEHFADYKEFIKKLKAGERAVCEYRIFDINGRRRFVRHTGNPILINEKIARVVGIIDDITEEKNILYKLEKAEEKFNLLIETADELIVALDSFGYISLVNKNGAKNLGFTQPELIGKHFLEFIDENTKGDIANAFQKVLSSQSAIEFETVIIDKFEQPLTFEFQATPTKDYGVISGMLAVGRNVTRRRHDSEKIKELNNKLVEANRIISIERDRAKQQITVLEEINKLKNDFISRVSHEFRTPLASIVGFAETIVSDEDLPPEMVNEFSGIILTEGKRLAKLINDVLDFSVVDSDDVKPERKDLNILEVLKKVNSTFFQHAEEKKIKFTENIPEAEIIVNADKEMISKAFSSILENAFKFTGRGGLVTVIIQDFLKEVEIIFSDTGCGISEEDLPHIFDKFTKGNHSGEQNPGAGLGLAYVKKVIDLHRGLIQVKSELEKGTTFIIKLPKK